MMSSNQYVMEKIVTLLVITLIFCLGILMAVLIDLVTGLNKAKKNGVIRSSYGYRRTVEKLVQYYSLIFALIVIDCMHIASIWYIDKFHGYNIIMFPFATLIGTLCIIMIEVKSIYEKAEDKQRFHEAGALLVNVAKNKDNIEATIKDLQRYLDVQKETEDKINQN